MKDYTKGISYTAIVISIISLVTQWVPWLHIRLLDVNYVISILSILVAALIGWNIYNVIEFKEAVKKTERIYYHNSARTKEGLVDVYLHILDINNEACYKLLQCIIDAIVCRSLMGDYSKCNILIDTFLHEGIKWSEYKLDNQQKNDIRKHLYDIESTKEIDLWPDFKEEIMKLTSTDKNA